MSMTPFSDDFINSRINSIYTAKNLETNEPAVYINMTIQLEENVDTIRPAVKHDIQRHLLRVIQRRNNNVGNSAIWVDSPPGSILALQGECLQLTTLSFDTPFNISNYFQTWTNVVPPNYTIAITSLRA